MAKEQQRVSASCWIWTNFALLTETLLNHWSIGLYWPTEKTVWIVLSSKLHSFHIKHFICNFFGCYLWLLSVQILFFSEWCQRLSPNFCAPPSELDSEVAVLSDWNLSSCPFLGQVVNLDTLLCTGLNLSLCLIFTQRPMNSLRDKWKFRQSNDLCFGSDTSIPSKTSSHVKKICCQWLVKFTAFKRIGLLNKVSIASVVALFLSLPIHDCCL